MLRLSLTIPPQAQLEVLRQLQLVHRILTWLAGLSAPEAFIGLLPASATSTPLDPIVFLPWHCLLLPYHSFGFHMIWLVWNKLLDQIGYRRFFFIANRIRCLWFIFKFAPLFGWHWLACSAPLIVGCSFLSRFTSDLLLSSDLASSVDSPLPCKWGTLRCCKLNMFEKCRNLSRSRGLVKMLLRLSQ